MMVAPAALALSACATRTELAEHDPLARSCRSFLAHLDELASSAGVTDAQHARLPGFPYLRIDRFLASFAADRPLGAGYDAWLERLRALDAESRRIELRNLPLEAARRLAFDPPAGHTVESGITECGRLLTRTDARSAKRRAELLARARVPDAYLGWRRVVGLYPLAYWPMREGVARLHRETREAFAEPLSHLPVAGRLVRYVPPATPGLSDGEMALALKAASQNALGIAEPRGEVLDGLFARHAPIWEIDTATEDDRVGRMRLDANGNAFVDVSTPVVYRLIAHARRGRESLLQLVYLVWLPARPSVGPWDIYAGPFDGLIWRVTLTGEGRALAYDSIHPCGCYYQVFPGEGFRVAQPDDGSEPVLSPAPLAQPKPGERHVIRIAHRTHFIQRVYAEAGPAQGIAYDFLDYDELRALKRLGEAPRFKRLGEAPRLKRLDAVPRLERRDGRSRSLFDERGLLPGSERPERFLFWPMGIASAGAMRQWGSHAIAFLGRRHFDDPRLLEGIIRPIGP